jgi:hypothetical protein
MDEVWKPVFGNMKYEVSNHGVIRSLDDIREVERNGYVYKRIFKGRILKTCKNKDGYKMVWMTNVNRESKGYGLHRIIAITFIPNPENKEQVNHKNGIKDDNRIENLEWVSVSENAIHAFNLGLRKSAFNHGDKLPMSTRVKMSQTAKRRIKEGDLSSFSNLLPFNKGENNHLLKS